MKANRFSMLSLALAAATFMVVVGYVQLSLPSSDAEENHLAIALMAGTVFRAAALIGAAVGAIGILLATVALMRKERLILVLVALAANLPIPILSAMILLRSFKS